MPEPINLGYANGWTVTPPIIDKCRELHHVLDMYSEGNCLTRYSCPVCGYEYLVDSSD